MYAKFWKRVFDFCIALVALIVLSPLFLVLIVVGARKMKGNPFFVQKRPGKINRKTGKETIFSLYKFRTMTNERDENGNLLPDEKRLVPYGIWLRRTSCDELPQLINVLKGDCALIGPRPLLVKYLPYYSEEQRHRHDVRPGITGYAQSHGRNALTWDEKFELDLYYVRNLSFIMDIRVLVDTVKAVLKHEGISQDGQATMEDFTEYVKAKSGK